ncbi:SDR family oxidoreductase [candidate division KSB1 bacterium]|nr:SDR family oxidoreductase [candidate division KSB1 bacterium]
MRFNPDYWALILGGSSGFGLATAKKLSRHGMNICIVHRDRRGAMKRLELEYQEIRDTGVQVLTYNVNALSPEGVQETLDGLQASLGADGRVRMLLHSIAYGNLKLLSQEHPETHSKHRELLNKLSQELGVSKDSLQSTFDRLFDQGEENLLGVASPAKYNNEELLKDEDFALTIYSMGSSLVTWVQEVFKRKMFAADARVLGLTSEGNEIAWRGYAAVSAAKVVLESIARSIAVEYAPYGIRANIIQAGVTDTPALRLIPGNTHLKATAKRRNPFKRMTTPEDVANFIYLMCLDEAAWANGNIIRVDGGEHISG